MNSLIVASIFRPHSATVSASSATPKTATYSSALTFISTLASTNVLPGGGTSRGPRFRLRRAFHSAPALPTAWPYAAFPGPATTALPPTCAWPRPGPASRPPGRTRGRPGRPRRSGGRGGPAGGCGDRGRCRPGRPSARDQIPSRRSASIVSGRVGPLRVAGRPARPSAWPRSSLMRLRSRPSGRSGCGRPRRWPRAGRGCRARSARPGSGRRGR